MVFLHADFVFFLLRAHAVHSAMHLLANEMEYKALDDEI